MHLVAGIAGGLLASSGAPALQAAGLGLMLPGGGFLLWTGGEGADALVHLALAVAAFAAVLAGLATWFATGAVVLPFGLWLLAAAGAGLMGAGHHHGHAVRAEALWLVPAAAVAGWATALLLSLVSARAGLRERRLRNAQIASTAPRPTPLEPAEPELTPEELQLMRLVLDRALQPVEDFRGFEWRDQFQTAAVRYQLNVASYALSMAQYTRLPAFQGYLTQAQLNLAAKQQDHRVWDYWRLENLWGNLRNGADPIPRDNIMFTGFLATQLACFHAASGRRAFDEPGSLRFETPAGEVFAYDLERLAEILAEGWRTAPLGLIACEPNWVYPLCNAIAAAGVRVQDNLAGAHRWRAAEGPFLAALERELITPAGDFVPCRSSYLGVALPQIGGAVGQAFPCFFLNAALPALARRHWLVLRDSLLADDFRRRLWRIDVGNYGFSRASSFAATAAAAVEMGDLEVADRLLGALDEDCPRRVLDGVAHRPDASLWAHAAELLARAGRADALRDMATATPRAPALEPHIADAPYPGVLVAAARASRGALEAVLHPGAGPGVQTVR
ncbi:MAG TPA: hypothetical protein VF699_03905, partial [Caulobacteraceae bacterium]